MSKSAFHRELEEFEKCFDKLVAKNATLEESKNASEAKLEAADRETRLVREELEEVKRAYDSRTEQISNLQSQILSMDRAITENLGARDQNVQLKNQLAAQLDKVYSATAEIERQNAEIESLKKAEKNHAEILAKFKHYLNLSVQKTTQNKKLAGEIANLEKLLAQEKKESAQLRAHNEGLQGELIARNAENQHLRKVSTVPLNVISNLEDLGSGLQRAIEDLSFMKERGAVCPHSTQILRGVRTLKNIGQTLRNSEDPSTPRFGQLQCISKTQPPMLHSALENHLTKFASASQQGKNAFAIRNLYWEQPMHKFSVEGSCRSAGGWAVRGLRFLRI